MKNIILLSFLIIGILSFRDLYSQIEDSTKTKTDTLFTNVDSLSSKDTLSMKDILSMNDSLSMDDTLSMNDTLSKNDSLRNAFLNSPQRLKIIELINEVNEISSKVDLIHSENIVKFKATSMDQTGNIEIRVKKNDDIWFRIWGSLAFVSKDAFIAHFNRNNFVYFDNLNDKVIEGPTTDNNIGYIARIKCSYDDLLNVMSGSARIVYTNNDTLSMESEKNNLIIHIKGKSKEVKYWIEENKKYVEKYSYYNLKKKEYLRITYGNFVNVNGGYYARKVDITKPMSNEYLKVVNETYTTNNPNLNFYVNFPSDVRRVKWSK